MNTATFEMLPYVKIYLHATKYPSDNIGGFLIGSIDNNIIIVSDAIPVFHGAPVTPILEIAAQFASSQGKNIIGVYFANEIVTNLNTPLYIEKINKTIESNTGGRCLTIQLDGTLMNDKSNLCIHAVASKESFHTQTIDSIDIINSIIEKLLKIDSHRKLADVQDHFDTSDNNFLNPFLDELLKSL